MQGFTEEEYIEMTLPQKRRGKEQIGLLIIIIFILLAGYTALVIDQPKHETWKQRNSNSTAQPGKK